MLAHNVPAAQNLSPHCPIYHPKRRGMGARPHVSPSSLTFADAGYFLKRGYGGKAPPRFGRHAAFPSRLPEFLASAKMRPANLVFAHSYYTP